MREYDYGPVNYEHTLGLARFLQRKGAAFSL